MIKELQNRAASVVPLRVASILYGSPNKAALTPETAPPSY